MRLILVLTFIFLEVFFGLTDVNAQLNQSTINCEYFEVTLNKFPIKFNEEYRVISFILNEKNRKIKYLLLDFKWVELPSEASNKIELNGLINGSHLIYLIDDRGCSKEFKIDLK
jgi:hypothetical protein